MPVWSLDPVVLAGLAALALLFARGWARMRPQPHAWRALAFYSGLATIFVALISPLAALAEELFLAHMVQHLLLIMVAIPLLLLGTPSLVLLQGLPRAARPRAVRPLARQRALRAVLRVVSNPLVSLGTYITLLSLWHVPAWYDAALASAPVHALEHATFLLIATLFWGQVIDPEPWRAPLAHPLRIVYLFVATAHNTLLGGILSFAEPTLYAYGTLATRPFDLSAAADQQWGGIIMWVPGGMVHLVAISLVFAVWLAAEDRPSRLESRPLHDIPR